MNEEIIDINENTNTSNKVSLIQRYATDLTKNVYYTDPAIARDEELKKMILILFTPEKSPILVGKPGIGKTAIVEGLAWRIQNNMVPDALKGYTILKIDLGEHNISLWYDDASDGKYNVYTLEAIPPSLISITTLDEIQKSIRNERQ